MGDCGVAAVSMSAETTGFVRQISAVSPLDGDALDGSAQPKPKRRRAERRERMDASRTFFCSNPQCDHATWASAEQATHMAQEFWWAVQALVRLAPDSPEAMKLTGGVILRELTDDECRQVRRDAEFYRRRGTPVPIDVKLRDTEYRRRKRAGEIIPALRPAPPRRLEKCRAGLHEFTPENTVIRTIQGRVSRACRVCINERQRRNSARRKEQARLRLQQDPVYRAIRIERMRQYRLRKKQEAAADA